MLTELNLWAKPSHAFEGGTVTIYCDISKKSTVSNVKWFQNDIELELDEHNNNINIESNGSLSILKVYHHPAGVYTYKCKKGVIYEGSTVLIVRKRAHNLNPIRIYQIQAGESITLPCNVTSGPLKANMVWLKDGVKINFKNELRFSKLTNDSLAISSVIPSDTGEYVCVSTTELSSVYDIVKLHVQNVPVMPRIKEFVCYENRAQIEWQSGSENQTPTKYSIEGNTFDPDEWQIYNVLHNKHSIMISLRPYTNISFRVVAHNEFGASFPSERTKVCSTSPDYPSRNPDNVVGEGSEPTNLG